MCSVSSDSRTLSRVLQCGDIYGFSGRDAVSLAIRLRDLTRFSHVGIVWHLAGDLVLWESTTLSKRICILCGRRHDGVQVSRVVDRVKDYGGRAWRMTLRMPLGAEQILAGERWLLQQHGKPYDMKQVFWVVWTLRRFFPASGYDDRAFYCSELVIALLQQVGKLPFTTSPAWWRPAQVMRSLPRWGLYYRPWRVDDEGL